MVVSEFQLSMNFKLNSFINLTNKYCVFVLAFYHCERKRERDKMTTTKFTQSTQRGREAWLVYSLVSKGSVVVTLPCCFGTLAAQYSRDRMLEEAYSHHRSCAATGEKKQTHTIEKEQKWILKNNYKLENKPSTRGLWETPRFKV